MKKLIVLIFALITAFTLAACNDSQPDSADKITVSGKEYEATYFGEQDLTSFNLADYVSREYWRLENAYEDFKDKRIVNNLPYHNYPADMDIETGQVFVIDYTKTDGSLERKYYRSDGTFWQDNPSTVEFTVE